MQPIALPAPPSAGTPCGLSVEIVAEAYGRWALGHYVKYGRPTKTSANCRRALSLLYQSGLMVHDANCVGPWWVHAFRDWLASATLADGRGDGGGLARVTINEYVRHVVRMFRWAHAHHAAVSIEVYQSLKLAEPLKRGRSAAPGVTPPREYRRVRPLRVRELLPVLRRLPPVVSLMARVQARTAMRPCEVVAMRPCDLFPTRTEGVMVYRVTPETDKTDHSRGGREVRIGPRALALLRRLWPDDPSAYFFSPRASERLRYARLRESAKVRIRADAGRRSRRDLGDRYTTESYGRAVRRACQSAGVVMWSPNRLRHTGATHMGDKATLRTVQEALGHASIQTTTRYVAATERRLNKLAARTG